LQSGVSWKTEEEVVGGKIMLSESGLVLLTDDDEGNDDRV
jgi:hypothetical protein